MILHFRLFAPADDDDDDEDNNNNKDGSARSTHAWMKHK